MMVVGRYRAITNVRLKERLWIPMQLADVPAPYDSDDVNVRAISLVETQ